MHTVSDESLSFTEEEAIRLSELDSLEFGFLRLDANENQQLLERAVFYLDSIIARKVYKLEEARAKEEHDELLAIDATQSHGLSPAEMRLNIYRKYTRLLDENVPPLIYLLLGHYQLLLNLYDDALSAYTKHESLADESSRRNVSFLYGLALCCFHFGAFNRAILLFQQILYLQPNFVRRKEVHIRLGYIYKLRKDLEKSLRHFRQALRDESPSTWKPVEIQFQIGHLLEVCGRIKQAKAKYEQILENSQPDTAAHVQHLCLRQLAWVYQTGGGSHIAGKGDIGLNSTANKELAIRLLQKAVDLDSSNGKTWYLLGRCQAAVNRVQEAFRAYRSSIDKTEASADTWCSIGVLYQEQNQPMDALQAYFCAVQLDKCHVTAWVNLGTLYESMHQFKEAVKCYTNAVNADKRESIKPQVKNRLATLQQLLPRLPEKVLAACGGGGDTSMVNAGTGNPPAQTKLPTVDDAWDLPIPSELTQRQVQLMLQEANRSQCSAFSNSGNHWATLINSSARKLEEQNADPDDDTLVDCDLPSVPKQPKLEEDGCKEHLSAVSSPPISPPSVEEVSTLYTLLDQGNDLSARQRRQFQHIHTKSLNYLLYKKRHPETVQLSTEDPFVSASRHIFKNQTSTASSSEDADGSSATNASNSRAGVPSAPVCDASPKDSAEKANIAVGQQQQQQQQEEATVAELFSVAANEGSLGADQLPDDEFALLSDDLFAQLNGTGDDLEDIALFQNPTSGSGGGDGDCVGATNAGPSDQNPPPSLGDSKCPGNEAQGGSTQIKQEGDLAGQDQSGPSANGPSPPKPPTSAKLVKNLQAFLTKPLVLPRSPTAGLDASMTSKEILDAVSGIGRLGGPWWNSLLPEGSPLPCPPEKPFPSCPADKLLPPTPSVYLDKRKDAVSPDLARFCLSQPVVVVRGLAAALRMDLGLFSTKSLVEANPSQRIEIRTQPASIGEKSRFSTVSPASLGERSPWFLDSPRSQTTIVRYARYQAASFKEALREEKQGVIHHNSPSAVPRPPSVGGADFTSPGVERDASVYNKGMSNCGDPMQRNPKVSPNGKSGAIATSSSTPRAKVIRFGTNCDLSDEEKWLPQLHELTKLPTFVKVVSAANMLSHVGYPLLGVNTVQLYMKIPGSKTSGHQENNNFCSVNINIGPGDCEWFAVPEAYWGAMHRLTERHGLNFLTGSWWPDLEELRHEGIPVYRFLQKPGDLVWVNAGTVHWVQAVGWCNNIAWNVGPLTARQYQLAVDRFEYNRLMNVKSIVPMIHLSWQLAKNVKVGDAHLYELIRHTLLRTMVNSQLTLDFLEQLDISVKRHGKKPDDIAHSCQDCDIEVFNLLFVTTQDKKSEVRCLACARRSDPTLRSFTVLSEYYMHELALIYDNFQLQTQPIAAYSVAK